MYVLEWSLSEDLARDSDQLADSRQFSPGDPVRLPLLASRRSARELFVFQNIVVE
ncbi:hypothetical protein A2U01_0098653, partial [Trifolium medium]|nr:hypothetical protein [Trifolium medium]